MGDQRFYIDHDTIHDRITGKHVRTDPDFGPGRVFGEDGREECCRLLNSLAIDSATGGGGSCDCNPRPLSLDPLAEKLVRAILSIEWMSGDYNEPGCPQCGGPKRLYHASHCILSDALTAAGLPDQASRNAAREAINPTPPRICDVFVGPSGAMKRCGLPRGHAGGHVAS